MNGQDKLVLQPVRSDFRSACGGWSPSAPDFGSQDPRFNSHWEQNSADDITGLHCIKAFIITHIILIYWKGIKHQTVGSEFWVKSFWSLSYTVVGGHVRCDNAQVWMNAFLQVHAQNHGITDLSHFHACRPTTFEIFHAECCEFWLLCDNWLTTWFNHEDLIESLKNLIGRTAT